MVTIFMILPMSIFKRIFLWMLNGSDVVLNALCTLSILGGVWYHILILYTSKLKLRSRLIDPKSRCW